MKWTTSTSMPEESVNSSNNCRRSSTKRASTDSHTSMVCGLAGTRQGWYVDGCKFTSTRSACTTEPPTEGGAGCVLSPEDGAAPGDGAPPLHAARSTATVRPATR